MRTRVHDLVSEGICKKKAGACEGEVDWYQGKRDKYEQKCKIGNDTQRRDAVMQKHIAS